MSFASLKPQWLVRRQARRWFVTLDNDPEPSALGDFERWYNASSANARAFDNIRRMYKEAGILRGSPAVRRIPGAVEKPQQRTAPKYAMAAALGALIVASAVILVRLERTPIEAVLLASRLGEIREVPLTDGSKVTLDTESRVRVEAERHHRSATLETGRARFAITPGEAPFLIDVANARISTNGAIIDVARDGSGARVDIISGAAYVSEADSGDVRVSAQRTVALSPARQPTVRPLQRRADWTKGLLEFSATPLFQVAEVANRYSARKIILADRSIAGLRVTGVYKSGDSAALARSLAAALSLTLEIRADGTVVLGSGRTKRVSVHNAVQGASSSPADRSNHSRSPRGRYRCLASNALTCATSSSTNYRTQRGQGRP